MSTTYNSQGLQLSKVNKLIHETLYGHLIFTLNIFAIKFQNIVCK